MPRSEFDLLNDIFPVSHETYDRLIIYKNLLLKWQHNINLISDSTIDDIWERHFLDSVQLCPLIEKPDLTIVDLGTGGGFPGLVLSIILKADVHLIESDKKKCIFLREVSRETSPHTKIHNDRADNVTISDVSYIVSRACADVSQLLHWSEKIVSHETKCLFPKGKKYSIEIDDAKKKWEFEVKTHPSVTSKDSVVLELSHIRRRNHEYIKR